MIMDFMSYISVILALLFLSFEASSMEFGVTEIDSGNSSYWLVAAGEISNGDYEKLLSIIKERRQLPDSIAFSSPGGDVKEAMKMGKLIRSGLIETNSLFQCNSACFFMLVAGINRTINIQVGVHRPYFDKEYFKTLSLSEAQSEYAKIESIAREYLKGMGVPRLFLDRMMATPSDRLFYLDEDQFHQEIGEAPAAYHEYLIAKCGVMDSDEFSDARKIAISEVYEKAKAGLIKDIPPDSMILLQYESSYEYANSLPKGYRKYVQSQAREIESCKTREKELVRETYLRTLKLN